MSFEKPIPEDTFYHTRYRELRQAVQEYIEFVFSEDYHSDRSDNYENDIFEKAVELFYGEDMWNSINKRIDDSEEQS